MMRFAKIRTLLLALFLGFLGVFAVLWLLGTTATALAQGQAASGPESLLQPLPEPVFYRVFFTDPVSSEITDLSGSVIGEAVHTGKLMCNRDKCSQKTELSHVVVFTDPAFIIATVEYKFSTLQALDPEEERAVVSGVGTLFINDGKKAKFSFTAFVQNNRDGTLEVTYVASRPDASFIVPRAPGRMEIGR